MSGDETVDELDQLARAAARARGAALFPAAAQYAARALGATECFLSQRIDAGSVRTVAVFVRNATAPNYEYTLAGTPCETVLGGKIAHHETGLAGKFARGAQGWEGYFGVPLTATDGTVLGHFCVRSTDRLVLTARERLLCEGLAGRAAAELQLIETQQTASRFEENNRYLRDELQSVHDFDAIIGASPGLTRVLENVSRVAPTDATVLITGETGTGKELIARAIHAASRRSANAFIRLDCTALRDQDLSLDASFALARDGTIFLDEIGELGLETQADLLRILQSHETARATAAAKNRVDVRVIAVSNRDLKRATHNAQFREDLYYRLNVFPVELPPLRARAEDVPLLLQFFAQKYGPRTGRRVDGVDPDTLAELARYPWPGNVRELEHLVERALILNTSSMLKIPPEMLTLYAPDDRGEMAAVATGMHRVLNLHSAAPVLNLDDTESTGLHVVQREHILRVLHATHWVIEGHSGAALKLGLKPATLRHRMKKLGISRAQAQPGA